jgi:hypothetical protein
MPTTTLNAHGALTAAQLRKRVREMLAAYKTIHSLDMQWSSAVREGTITYSRPVARHFQAQYQRWLDQADPLWKLVKEAQRQGHQIPRAAEFRQTVGFCPAGYDLDQIAEDAKRLERGEGVPLTEAVHGKVLHRRAS